MKKWFLFKRNWLLFLTLAAFISSCSSVLYVAPRQVDCAQNEENPCYLIRHSTTGNWISHSEAIAGLDYEPGYSYKIKVNSERIKNPPYGASGQSYSLVKVLEKTDMTDDMDLDDLIGKEWKLEYLKLDNTQILTEEQVPFLKFDTDGKLSGFGGCNNFSGSYKLTGRKIDFGNIAATRKMCADSMDLETAFFEALQKDFKALFSDGKLILSAEGGNRMTFRYK